MVGERALGGALRGLTTVSLRSGLVELGGDLGQSLAGRRQPTLQVGDPLRDLLLARGEHGDLAVGLSGRVPRDVEGCDESVALGLALGPTPLLEVDG